MDGLRLATQASERGLVLSLLDCAITDQMHWIADVRAWLDPESHMTKGQLAKIAAAVFKLAASKGPITPEGIAIVLKADDPPGLEVISALIHDCPSQAAHLRFYALEVVKCWRARQTSKEATAASQEIMQGGDVDSEIERLSGLRAKLMPRECSDDGSYSVLDTMIEESLGEREPDRGFCFSCQTLTNGLERVPQGSLVVVAAPTGVGKTILLTQEATAAARKSDGISILFSVEMSVRQIVERIAKSMAGIPAIRSPEYSKALGRVREMLQDGHHLRIYAGPRSMDSIESIVSAQAERGKIAFLGVDYVQILTPDPRVKGSNREQEISHITKRLKNLAVSHDCVVMTASQLNKMGKVRESEAIEHDCDVCLVLSELSQQGYESRIGLTVEKNRHGTKGRKLVLAWDKALYRFRDLEMDDE